MSAPASVVTERVFRDLRRTLDAPGRAGQIWIASLTLVTLAGFGAYAWQLAHGLQVTGMRDVVSWGLYMANFVFFIGISHAGTLISAILRVTGAEWRRPITRMAEAITCFALLVGAPMVFVDMGRPDRLWEVLVYGRLNSPILWDALSIFSYFTGSILYLYVAMIPDIAMLAREGGRGFRPRIWRALSLGYAATPVQRRALERALATMAIVIIPVAISVHTVVSWIFGMTLRPGWHSTIFGPYFVVGAIFSGTAAIILAMAVFRRVYRLEAYITTKQFANLGKLLLALDLLYIYFTASEYVTDWYSAEWIEKRLLATLMGPGAYGAAFWTWAVLGLLLPAALLIRPGKSIARLVVACSLITAGMWVKRYLIVVPTLMTPFLPVGTSGLSASYTPTWVEWAVTAGAAAFFLLAFTLFSKLFPIVSVWETAEGIEELGAGVTGVSASLSIPEPEEVIA